MKAEIFSIGTELLMGELTDTNAAWIATKLPPLGIQLQWVSIIGDNLDMLAEAFTRGWQRSDIIFTTGGLGPTQDDLTREGIARALGEAPTVDADGLKALEANFRNRGIPMPAHNIKQAHLIPSARFIPNRNGTAPGWWVEKDGKIIISMPGPPGETHPLWEELIEPQLREIVKDEVTVTRNIKTMGMSEAAIDEVISEFFGHDNPYLGIYSKADGIHLRVIARARDTEIARQMIAPVEEAIHSRLGPYIWGYDDQTPELATGQALEERGLTLAIIESATGGFLANSITDAPNSYKYFKGGVVAFSDEIKILNGVPKETLERHGPASPETALAMAEGIRQKLGADFGIGLAGATAPSEAEGRPVGQLYLAIAGADEVKQWEYRVPPRRVTIKRRASNSALIELGKMINALGGRQPS